MVTKSFESMVTELKALSEELPRLCAGSTFTISGKKYTAKQAARIASQLLASELAVVHAFAAYRTALTERDKAHRATDRLLADLRILLVRAFMRDTTALTRLGLRAPKPRTPLTPAAKLAKRDKGRATRVARGTKGTRQKAKIHGTVTKPNVTPIARSTE
jgi:hypothetical protein